MELTDWMAYCRRALGARIDNGDGQVVRGALPVTLRMPRQAVEQAAEALGEDFNEVRTMSPYKLFDRLKAVGY